MSRAIHIARGYCCEADPQCQECPYHGARQATKKRKTRPNLKTDPLLIDYIRRAAGGETLIYYSEIRGLIDSVQIAENLTIKYRKSDEQK